MLVWVAMRHLSGQLKCCSSKTDCQCTTHSFISFRQVLAEQPINSTVSPPFLLFDDPAPISSCRENHFPWPQADATSLQRVFVFSSTLYWC